MTLIFTYSLVAMVPVAYGAEHDPVLTVLYSDTDDKIMSGYKADVENIDNMSQIDVRWVEIHTTSKGKICAVVVDNDYNPHSAYHINGSGVPKHLDGEDKEICLRNTETLHSILTFSPVDTQTIIFVLVLVVLLTFTTMPLMRRIGRKPTLSDIWVEIKPVIVPLGVLPVIFGVQLWVLSSMTDESSRESLLYILNTPMALNVASFFYLLSSHSLRKSHTDLLIKLNKKLESMHNDIKKCSGGSKK